MVVSGTRVKVGPADLVGILDPRRELADPLEIVGRVVIRTTQVQLGWARVSLLPLVSDTWVALTL